MIQVSPRRGQVRSGRVGSGGSSPCTRFVSEVCRALPCGMSELARFLRTVVLKHHLSFLPVGNWNSFAHAVAERLAEEWSLAVDYVRLNMLATRSGSA